MSKDNSGPAFPVADFDHMAFAPKNVDEHKRLLSGVTLRDYFAAKALPAVIHALEEADHQELMRRHGMEIPSIYALEAYEIADAMVAVRSRS